MFAGGGQLSHTLSVHPLSPPYEGRKAINASPVAIGFRGWTRRGGMGRRSARDQFDYEQVSSVGRAADTNLTLTFDVV